MIVANQYDTFVQMDKCNVTGVNIDKYMLFNGIYERSYNQSMLPGGSRNSNTKGYTLATPGLWQGNFTELQVIGDKSGPIVLRHYQKHRFAHQYRA